MIVRCVALALLATVTLGRPSAAADCDVAAASPWIERWLSAWELTSREILKLREALRPVLGGEL